MADHSSVELRTSDGETLEAQLATPAEAPTHLMALCHPHPLYGGNMHNGVVDGLFRQLPQHGVACLRFNFRGAGGSTGRHDHGEGEQLDVGAAIDELGDRWPELPLTLAGYSFGADVSLATDHDRHRAWLAIAPPLQVVDPEIMTAPSDDRPKLLVIPEHDQFNPPERARATVAAWTNTSAVVIPSADHFLASGLTTVVTHALTLTN